MLALFRTEVLFRRLDRIEEGEEFVYSGNLKKREHARRYARHREATSGALTRSIGAQYGSQCSRIHVGDRREIQDKALGLIAPDQILELKQLLECQSTLYRNTKSAGGALSLLKFEAFHPFEATGKT